MPDIKLQSEYDDLDKYKNGYGDIYYCKENTKIFHNPYGPAYIFSDGRKVYYIEGKWHRLDGPAVLYSNGEGRYWINDEPLNEKEFETHPERLKYLGKDYLICIK